MNARIPSGGNVAMLDGHVEWRPFASMLPRVPGASPTPVFWW
jgi:prepilin-type processing-associated H-X9-DG protein